ncbi:MAG: endonuclease/exonuclease/phosphatase family protein [Ignavibacteria bacterium]|nr:endonuclease/exonuclease/phosphatase family protein [Ignavibacteria bacterium]
MKKLYLLLLLLLAITSAKATVIVEIRICTYNLLNYSLANEDGRTAKFKMIMDTIQPDILVCQDVVEAPAVAKFLSEALDKKFMASPFHSGYDTQNQLFYNSDKIELLSADYYKTSLRDIAEYRVRSTQTGDTIFIFSVHLKASDTDSDAVQRGQDARILYERMAERDIQNGKIILVGDFNFYSTEEEGYQVITYSRTLPTLVDPVGDGWKRNDIRYPAFYTQSTRNVADAACGGGTGGGMDDRFDYIFLSQRVMARLIQDSYTHFGNDGTSRINKSIDNPYNTYYTSMMASNLRCASDHLPVYCDFYLVGPSSVDEDIDGTSILPSRYFDILGREVASPEKGVLYLKVSGGRVEKVVG